ncbi:MAG: hypothetical protein JWN62_2620 [Acidimicrobiales bacterium]|nr:hypothetical protein [Acidimicrobiales bacterium]
MELEISDQTIYNWRRQHLIDTGQAPGITSTDHVELVAARKRISELEVELAATRRANELLNEVVPPEERFEIVATMVSEGFPIQVSCRVLEVAESSYYGWRSRKPSIRSLRHTWASEIIRQVHTESRGTYGARRVHAEMILGRNLTIGHNQVELLMRRAGLKGLPGNKRRKQMQDTPTSGDLVKRNFDRDQPRSAVGHRHHRAPDPRRQGLLRGRARHVLPACDWLVDRLGSDRGTGYERVVDGDPEPQPTSETIIHSDHGVQFTSWAFTRRALESGLVPSMGSIGDCYDNGLMESFWGRMQTELLDRQRWRTRLELANAMFDYLEIFHNRQRPPLIDRDAHPERI